MPDQAHAVYGKPLYTYLLGFYYLSFVFIPWTGNRNFCRWACPWGGVWGILGYMGLREVGKWKGHSDAATGGTASAARPSPTSLLGKALAGGGHLVSGIRRFFSR